MRQSMYVTNGLKRLVLNDLSTGFTFFSHKQKAANSLVLTRTVTRNLSYRCLGQNQELGRNLLYS